MDLLLGHRLHQGRHRAPWDETRWATSTAQGNPAPNLLKWLPELINGTFTGQGQAGWNVTGNADYVVIGGEFPRAGNVGQQGLVRYAVPGLAPNDRGP